MRLNIFLLIFISTGIFARTPDEFCKEHIDFDDLFVKWKNERQSETPKYIDKQDFMEKFSKNYLWSMENYFSCRESYENLCKQTGKVGIKGWHSKTIKENLDCSAFK